MYRQIEDFYARGLGGDLAHLHLKSAKKGFGPKWSPNLGKTTQDN